MTEKTPADRLKELRIKRGFATARDACRAFGWNEATYRGHENGFRGFNIAAAERYAKAFNSSAAYILTGGDNNVPISPVVGVTQVPVIGVVSAGAFRLTNETAGFDYHVPAVTRPDIPEQIQYALLIDGESVNQRIANGAYAICAPLERMPGGVKHGQLVHVVRERAGLFEHTIKQIEFGKDAMALIAVSNDPRFQGQIELRDGASEDDITVTIQGVVIGAFQRM